jgi:hypothetical protein
MIKFGESGTTAEWHDEFLPFLSKLGALGQIERVSHIDPGPLVDGRPTWVIRWLGEFAERMGGVTTYDEHGAFFTKGAAEKAEVKMLRVLYFRS